MISWFKQHMAPLAILAALALISTIGIATVAASSRPVNQSSQTQVYDDEGDCKVRPGDLNGDCELDPLPTAEPPVTDGDGFRPGICEGDLRFDEGLTRGFAGPTTQEMMEALRMREGGEKAPHDFLVRVGSECAAWHVGLGSIAPFSTVLPNEVAGFRNFLYQVGIVDENFERIMTDSNGRRVGNIRQLVIRWVGDPEGEHTYPFGTWVYNCDDALRESNSWGSADVDDPSFQYVLDSCGGNYPTESIVNRSSPDDDPDLAPAGGGNGGDLASLQCNNPETAATWINQNATNQNGRRPNDQQAVKADDLENPPAPGDRVYEHGWYWRASANHTALSFDLDSLGWFRIDFDGGSIESGSTPLVKGATFWCRP